MQTCQPSFRVFIILFYALAGAVALRAQPAVRREIAITIDDLPAADDISMTGMEILDMTAKILNTLREQKVPAVGFVNERKLYRFGQVDDRIKALNLWLDDGFELGNHTFSHYSLNQVGLQRWEDDVVRGYRIAPITMDAWDWMYAGVYEDARTRGDAALQKKLVDSYLEFTATVFDYNEKLSRDLLGYEPKQILLLHGNWLEAEHISQLLDLLRKRGYQFVSLQDALSDGAYSMPDEYVGEEGTGWLEHWAITRGQPLKNTPVFPQWVIDLSKALPHPPPEPPIF
jgi:peptidoglycan/xylan/chitin deacetylase (PgdA/CDA1 family)